MLSTRKIDSLKPKGKLYREADKEGLSIEVTTNGSKLWRFRYRFNGSPKMIGLGIYPTVSLKEARDKVIFNKKLLEKDINPSGYKNEKKEKAKIFSYMFELWFKKNESTWTPRYAKKLKRAMEIHILPVIGERLVATIKPIMIYNLLEDIEDKGKLETRDKTKGWMNKVFNLCVIKELIEYNPISSLDSTNFKKKIVTHRSTTVDPAGIAKILRAIDGHYSGRWQLTIATKLAPHLMLRPGELAGLKWSEIDFKEKLIRIDPERMKMRRAHEVPMSDQVMVLLKEAESYNSVSDFVFPGCARNDHITVEGIETRLKATGIKPSQLTPHGWRAMASTRLNEGINNNESFNWDAIEKQLAHVESNSSRKPYNRAIYIEQRRAMMQKWSDYLDMLRTSG